MNIQCIPGPVAQVVVKIGCGVGKGAEHHDLAVLLAFGVGRRVVDLLLDDPAQIGQFGITIRRHGVCHTREQGKLILVLLQVCQPSRNIQMRHRDLQLAADLECLGKFIVFFTWIEE